ncbi:MAG: TraR/DksA family transcriptional regulator [Rhizobacter sp.]|jgi:DnaK suppressor protein
MDLATQTHLTTLRNFLSVRLKELEHDLARPANASARGPDVTEVVDQKDQAERQQAGTVEAAEEERDRHEMADVRAALSRLDAGTYGDCEACGQAIPMQRLLAQPAARRCAPCQQALEQANARRVG